MLYLLTLMSITKLEFQKSVSIVSRNELLEGDHIFRFGAIFEKSFLTHHGIYVGEGKVIHFSGGESKANDLGRDILDAEIKLVSFNDKGDKIASGSINEETQEDKIMVWNKKFQ